MIRTYKHSNGRVVARRTDGTFRNFTSEELLGNQGNHKGLCLVCASCGYGKDQPWRPVLITGYCPNCKNQEGHLVREVPESFRQKVIRAKIRKYKTLIGIDFISPLAYREYSPKLNHLKYKLDSQIRLDEYNSFGYPDLSGRKFKNGQICVNQFGNKIEILDTAGFEKINEEWIFRYKVCRLNKKGKRERRGVYNVLETNIN